jgi:hypothetical protein
MLIGERNRPGASSFRAFFMPASFSPPIVTGPYILGIRSLCLDPNLALPYEETYHSFSLEIIIRHAKPSWESGSPCLGFPLF